MSVFGLFSNENDKKRVMLYIVNDLNKIGQMTKNSTIGGGVIIFQSVLNTAKTAK